MLTTTASVTSAPSEVRRIARRRGPALLAEGSARDLTALLTPVVGIIDRRSQFPVARSVLVRRNGQEVSVSATDLETLFSNTARFGGSDAQRAAAAIDGVAMLKVLKGLPKEDPVQILVHQGKARLARGTNSYVFGAFPEEEFPDFVRTVPQGTSDTFCLAVDAAEMHRGIVAVRNAMAEHDTRTYLNGMLLKADETQILVAATNGHWLAKYALRGVKTGGTTEVILPHAAVVELAKATKSYRGAVTIRVVESGQQFVTVQIGELRVTTRPLTGAYPNLGKVLSDGRVRDGARLQREGLLSGLKRLKPGTTRSCPGVELAVSRERCGLTVQSHEATCREEVQAQYTGRSLKVGINLTYLLDAIAPLDTDEVVLSLPQEVERDGCVASPILVTSDAAPSYVAVIMPLRL